MSAFECPHPRGTREHELTRVNTIYNKFWLKCARGSSLAGATFGYFFPTAPKRNYALRLLTPSSECTVTWRVETWSTLALSKCSPTPVTPLQYTRLQCFNQLSGSVSLPLNVLTNGTPHSMLHAPCSMLDAPSWLLVFRKLKMT